MLYESIHHENHANNLIKLLEYFINLIETNEINNISNHVIYNKKSDMLSYLLSYDSFYGIENNEKMKNLYDRLNSLGDGFLSKILGRNNYENLMKNKIKNYISNQPICPTIAIINGEKIQGKYLENIDIIIKININVFDAGFSNRDICRIIGETIDDKLVVKRLEDGKIGIVEKNKVSFPIWERYDL